MKIGKKFLSLLMGVAVLLVSSLPAFAAEVETADLFFFRFITIWRTHGCRLDSSHLKPWQHF